MNDNRLISNTIQVPSHVYNEIEIIVPNIVIKKNYMYKI